MEPKNPPSNWFDLSLPQPSLPHIPTMNAKNDRSMFHVKAETR
jgi:hypothetical protein